MKTYPYMYLGLVINNNDPEYRGRIQVFIPHIMPALYENWNKEGKDISISCIGDNLEGSLSSDIVLKLQKILPWAEAASPIIGSSSPGGVLQSIGDAVGSFVGGVKNFFSQTPTANPTRTGVAGTDIANSALELVGRSTANLPGTDGGNLGCAAAISMVFKNATGKDIIPGQTIVTGTTQLYEHMSKSSDFIQVPFDQIQPGDIPVTARGTRAGHTGIYVGNGRIVSNSSSGFMGSERGTIQNNYSIDSWQKGVVSRNPEKSAVFRYVGPGSTNSQNPTDSQLTNIPSPEESNSSLTPPEPNYLVTPQGPQGSEPQVATAPSTSIQAGGPEAGLSGTTSSLIKPELIVSGAQATRYGFIGDPYQNSNDRKVGNAGNPVHTGMVALSPELRKQYNLVNGDVIALKKGNSVTYGVVGNQTASNLPTTGGGPSGRRVDFLDLNNELKDIDGLGDLYVINRGPKRTGKGLEGQEATNYATEQYYKTLELAKTGQIDFENAVINNTQTQGILPETPPSVVNNTFGHGRTIQKNTNDMAKGLFAFPNTGAMVWVFFREGNPLFPVYFAASYSSIEWQSAYRGSSINASGTNTGNPSPNEISNSAQMNFNSAGGIEATEVINASDPTKTKKVLMVHGPDGSNRAFTPGFAQDYIKGNFLQHVDSNSFRITHGYEEKWVEADSNYNIRGNHIVKVGKFDQEAIDAMKALSDMSYEINQTLKSSKS